MSGWKEFFNGSKKKKDEDEKRERLIREGIIAACHIRIMNLKNRKG